MFDSVFNAPLPQTRDQWNPWKVILCEFFSSRWKFNFVKSVKVKVFIKWLVTTLKRWYYLRWYLYSFFLLLSFYCLILLFSITFIYSTLFIFAFTSVQLTGIYLLKVNNRNTGISCEICSKLTKKTPELRHWHECNIGTICDK